MKTFVDMKMSDAEAKDMFPSTASVAPEMPSRPQYPYGLCLLLGEDEIAKLGLSGELPSVGDMIHGAFMANVTSVSEREEIGGDGKPKKCCRVELQVTHLAVEDEDREVMTSEKRAAGRYGGGLKDDGDDA